MSIKPELRSPAEREIGLGLMGSFSVWHWLVVAVVVLLFFGRGKISEVMGDVAKGIKSFKRGMAEDEQPAAQPRPIERAPGEPVATSREEHRSAN
jgi:sec-independent protein translocase protein TatA